MRIKQNLEHNKNEKYCNMLKIKENLKLDKNQKEFGA